MSGWDFDVGADGTPYVAGLHCEGDACYQELRLVPTVMRYEGGVWTAMSSEGLPAVPSAPSLLIGTDGTPHVLCDLTEDATERRSAVFSLNGASWEQRSPEIPGAFPGTGPAPSLFLQDVSGRLYTTMIESPETESTLVVLRLEQSIWQELGRIVTDPSGTQLAVRDDDLCVTTTYYSDGSEKILVICREGLEWFFREEIVGYLGRGFGIGRDGAVYLVRDDYLLGTVMRSAGDAWTELTPTEAETPLLTVTTGGSVFLLGNATDTTPRLARWDDHRGEWSYYTTEGLDGVLPEIGGSAILAVAEIDGQSIPYLAYTEYDAERGLTIAVLKHE